MEDAALAERLLAGDAEAFAGVRRWVRGALGPYRRRLAADLEDLEQEVVVALVETLRAGRFEGRSRLSTYVRRMVHYRCLNRLRTLRRREMVDVDDAGLEDGEPTPFERARRRQELAVGLRVLAEMPAACRELWAMIHRGLSYDAMAERLHVAAGTLRVRVHRCREKALAARDRLGSSDGNAVEGRVT
ncbi:MAG: sigma-70 family RNA polymerase sigma factor [Holophagales bacterium]|nr:sigma-70 family RNA polymerase sigma factor [Holophagales bacterium]